MDIRVAAAALAALGLSHLASFDGGQGWINSKPLSPAALAGKVVLVDFWEYTCVNCLATLPYQKAWFDRYAKYGFTIVGVHTPDFSFSAEPRNVDAAVRRLGIEWPVVLDDERAIWDRYGNEVWPRQLLFDASGRLIADHAGEGDYPEMERQIQDALHRVDPSARFPAVMGYLPRDSYAKPGAVCYRHTPEMYVGPGHGAGALGNPQGYGRNGRIIAYTDAPPHGDGRAYLQGPWSTDGQALVSATGAPGPHLTVRYQAIQAVAVLASGGAPLRVLVYQDGAPLPARDAGSDVRYDAAGRSYLEVDAPREYEVVLNKHFGQHELELLPQAAGLGVYAFDFEACEVGADR
jgi:thiol-disulfide isomerase/thioredoxin